MNSSLVAVVGDEIRRFLQAHPTQRATRVHIPRSWRILGLFTEVIRHTIWECFARRLAFDFSVAGAIAKSTCRLKRSTRATNTDNSSPTLNRLRDRLPMSCRRAG